MENPEIDLILRAYGSFFELFCCWQTLENAKLSTPLTSKLRNYSAKLVEHEKVSWIHRAINLPPARSAAYQLSTTFCSQIQHLKFIDFPSDLFFFESPTATNFNPSTFPCHQVASKNHTDSIHNAERRKADNVTAIGLIAAWEAEREKERRAIVWMKCRRLFHEETFLLRKKMKGRAN
jgi:hypothetical protein